MASPARFLASLILALALQAPAAVADDQQAVLITAAPSLFDATVKHAPLDLDGYTYHGCWADTTGSTSTAAVRSIGPGRFTFDESMTTSKCLSYCSELSEKSRSPMRYAALLEGHTCHCSTTISPFFSRLDDEASRRCSLSCAGDSDQVCGGSAALTVYRLSEERGGGPFFEEERFTTTTITTTTQIHHAEQGQRGSDEPVSTEQEAASQTGIAWSQYAGPSTWYGILAAITFVIAAVI